MGMFDDIVCKYPLPVPGANALRYQTKDTPMQYLDLYEIREDGTIWHEEYDTEDQSELGKWLKENPGKTPNDAPASLQGLQSICGLMTRVNKRWVFCDNLTAAIYFYSSWESPGQQQAGWIEFCGHFLKGHLKELTVVENTPP